MISEVKIRRVDADVLAVKEEKLHDFGYLTQSNQQKAERSRKKRLNYKKWWKISARSFKEVLFA